MENTIKKKREEMHEQRRKQYIEKYKNKKREQLMQDQQQEESINQQSEGHLVNQQQQIFMKQENFKKVFSSKKIDDLHINWKIFQKQNVYKTEYNAKQKIYSLFKLKILISSNFGNQNIQHHQLSQNFYELIKRMNKVEEKRLKKLIKLNFSEPIKFDFKKNGVQFGIKFHCLSTGERFFVKSHSAGLLKNQFRKQLSVTSQVTEKVDIREVFIYKLLQYLNIGQQAHFFGRNICNVYICTKDAGHQNPFLTFEELKDNPQHQQFFSSQVFSTGIIQLDILSRLLFLTDVISNGSNFGFSSNKIRIIDFRLRAAQSNNQKDEIQQVNVNEIQKAANMIKDVFKQEKVKLEKVAKQFFQNELKNFHHYVQQGQKIVLSTISKNIHKKQIIPDQLINSFHCYIKKITKKYNNFCLEMKICIEKKTVYEHCLSQVCSQKENI